MHHKKKRQPGCQIDYLVQTKLNELYLHEIKFHKDALGNEIIAEVQEKMKKFTHPKNFSVRPILIHVNGVKSSLEDSGFFMKILSFSKFLE